MHHQLDGIRRNHGDFSPGRKKSKANHQKVSSFNCLCAIYSKKFNKFSFSFQRICPKRSELFGCIDANSEPFYRCLYPGEIEYLRNAESILKRMMDLICSYDEDDFAFYDLDGELEQCVKTSRVDREISTCAHKAVYFVAKRILEKWILNEHFRFEIDAQDCKWVTPKTNIISILLISFSFQCIQHSPELFRIIGDELY